MPEDKNIPDFNKPDRPDRTTVMLFVVTNLLLSLLDIVAFGYAIYVLFLSGGKIASARLMLSLFMTGGSFLLHTFFHHVAEPIRKSLFPNQKDGH